MPTSRSLLSRWESGEIPISYEAMAAYEQVLGLDLRVAQQPSESLEYMWTRVLAYCLGLSLVSTLLVR